MPSPETAWMCKAFVNLKAALMSEIIAVSGEYVFEEYIRGALMRGLMFSDPPKAGVISAECEAPWARDQCYWKCGKGPGGRPPAHDIGILSTGKGLEAVCEVKWIVTNRAADLRKDIWKLALTRGVASAEQATKTYMAVAGQRKAIGDTLQSLRNTGLDLRWSSQGRGGKIPKPRQLRLLRTAAKHPAVCKALTEVLSWGGGHLRTPPRVWAALRVSVRDRWWLTLGSRKWVAVLWELDTWGGSGTTPTIDWNVLLSSVQPCT